MHRFFIPTGQLYENQVVFVGPQAHQIKNVLRMRVGDSIIVLDNTGYEYIASLTQVEQRQVIAEVVNRHKSEAEPKTRITLYQSLLVREKFEWILQKCTEVGVSHFVPVITQRSLVRQPQVITPKKMSRWQSILTEAAEQSGRGRIPTLENPLLFTDALAGFDGFDCCLVGSTAGNGKDLRNILSSSDTKLFRIALLIGPEGGFTDEEIAEACSRGAKAFSLGKRILRTETAAIVASALILHELSY
jgi:16S rRNA (uracil1498-N3)-methyltransferase